MAIAKRCQICGENKPKTPDHFYRASANVDGYKNTCKTCCAAKKQEQRRQLAGRRSAEIVYPEVKRCPTCNTVKPAGDFDKNRTSTDGLASQCKKCQRIRKRQYEHEHCAEVNRKKAEWARRNPDKRNATNKRWRSNNPKKIKLYEKAKKANRTASHYDLSGRISAAEIVKQFDTQGGKCYWCERELEDYHIDHVIPFARGGPNNMENIVVSCPRCNQRKHTKLPHEWDGTDRIL